MLTLRNTNGRKQAKPTFTFFKELFLFGILLLY